MTASRAAFRGVGRGAGGDGGSSSNTRRSVSSMAAGGVDKRVASAQGSNKQHRRPLVNRSGRVRAQVVITIINPNKLARHAKSKYLSISTSSRVVPAWVSYLSLSARLRSLSQSFARKARRDGTRIVSNSKKNLTIIPRMFNKKANACPLLCALSQSTHLTILTTSLQPPSARGCTLKTKTDVR